MNKNILLVVFVVVLTSCNDQGISTKLNDVVAECNLAINVYNGQLADWVIGDWKFYQSDGITWLFDIKIARVGQVYEFRLVNWNENVYYAKCESGRLVSRLSYDVKENIFTGDHYRVEDASFYGKVRLIINNSNYLQYEGINSTEVNGQYIKRSGT